MKKCFSNNNSFCEKCGQKKSEFNQSNPKIEFSNFIEFFGINIENKWYNET